MSRLMSGDVVARRKGLVMHKGVLLADGRVLHNTPGRGEHTSTLDEFRRGQRVYRVGSRASGRYLTDAGVGGRGYNLFTNNCEHTVSRVTDGRAHSQQLRGWVAGASLAAVAFALTRHPGLGAAGFALGRSLVARLDRRD
ncbi:MAG: hypothetical protein RIC56_08875 [Pseudomonadales bacterium]